MNEPIGPQAVNDSTECEIASRSWWLWMAWIERTDGGGFVYGCAAPNSRLPGWSDEAVIEIPGGKLVIHQAIGSNELGCCTQSEVSDAIDTARSACRHSCGGAELPTAGSKLEIFAACSEKRLCARH